MKVILDKDILALREKYIKAHIKTQRAEVIEREFLIELRKSCNHSLVAEVPYETETSISSSSPSFRVCEICGNEEEGTFYKILNTTRVRTVRREEGYQLRQPLEDIEY